jgi:hypothetical protein
MEFSLTLYSFERGPHKEHPGFKFGLNWTSGLKCETLTMHVFYAYITCHDIATQKSTHSLINYIK